MADRPTDSQRGCLWRIPTEEVSLSELSGTVMCIRLCKRPLQRQGIFFFLRVGGVGFFFFFFVGDIMRDSLAVYLFSDHYSSKPLIPHDSDGQG